MRRDDQDSTELGMKLHRRRVLQIAAAAGVLVAVPICRPAAHLARTALRDTDAREPLPPHTVDDASRLNRTRVAQIWSMPEDAGEAEEQLAQLLLHAQRQQLHIAVAGARHTMGGQTIYPDGIQLNMLPFKQLALDQTAMRLHVQAGARWAEVIPYLEQTGHSVAVMQSNNTFSVAGSVNANAHGWQHNHPPLASTVGSCRVMRANGQIVRCSRTEN
ncbi:MAG TPA: FAD-dependent oxidoreductase, partial [Herpetosiphonaceae bacterium]|nr:FAD-dependent oxidoreductase [Herpetosiphonaceae bacterium]